MNIEDALVAEEARSLLAAVQASCAVRTRVGFVNWLQGEMQELIPHDLVIVAWGKFESGAITFDIIPSAARLGAVAVGQDELHELLSLSFSKWLEADQLPVKLDLTSYHLGSGALQRRAPWLTAAVAHGLKDRRGHYDCIYLFLGRSELATSRVHERLRLLLPSIDTGCRQAALGLPQVASSPAPAALRRAASSTCDLPNSQLSAREVEVMGWVRMGKTNSEIALIMDLSTFTIKNHMRRIYKKLDVLNRAQAVGRLGASTAS
jgi:transcriptional regulator EpsA